MKWVTKAKAAAVPPLIAVDPGAPHDAVVGMKWNGSDWITVPFGSETNLDAIAANALTDVDLEKITDTVATTVITAAPNVTSSHEFQKLMQDIAFLKAEALVKKADQPEIVGVAAALDALSKAGVGIKSISQHSSYDYGKWAEIELTMTVVADEKVAPEAMKQLHEWAIKNGPGGGGY